jgi:hypothetical protein
VSLFSLSKQPAGVRPGPARRWPPLRCFVSPPAPRPPAPARPRPPCRCQWVRVAGVHRFRLRDSQCRRHHPVFRVAVEWAAPSVCIGVAKSLLSVLASLPTVAKFTEQTKNGWPLTQRCTQRTRSRSHGVNAQKGVLNLLPAWGGNFASSCDLVPRCISNCIVYSSFLGDAV